MLRETQPHPSPGSPQSDAGGLDTASGVAGNATTSQSRLSPEQLAAKAGQLLCVRLSESFPPVTDIKLPR